MPEASGLRSTKKAKTPLRENHIARFTCPCTCDWRLWIFGLSESKRYR